MYLVIFIFYIKNKRNLLGYSLIETMTVLAVIGIVVGLLYAYSDEGWNLFYQSYGRGLSQVKAKLAIRTLSEDLREANKKRISVNHGSTYGVPLPDDVTDNSPSVYFTKPKFKQDTGDIIAYDYVLYYFARPKEVFEAFNANRRKKGKEKENFIILKSIRFLNQSKFYTEDEEKPWPFLPPLLENQKSTLPEDEAYINSLNQGLSESEDSAETDMTGEEQFLDHFSRLKKESRNLPISGNFLASYLTDPFTSEEVNIFFGQSYKSDKPIKIKVAIQESPFLLGLMGAMNEFEVKITPRN